MDDNRQSGLEDTGERMIPAAEGEVSFVYARHKFAYEFAQQYARSKRVLDVGCGTGYGCKILSKVAESVVGIDYKAEAIAFCKTNFPASNISFVQAEAGGIQYRSEFDLAVSFQVIEHMPNLHTFLEKLIAAVRPGGTILITTPNAREASNGDNVNPFHLNEMNYEQFRALLSKYFPSFDLLGIGYASSSRLRTLFQRSPLYRLGKYFHRKSAVKKIANAAMRLTEFRILDSNIAGDAIDLLAVCHTE